MLLGEWRGEGHGSWGEGAPFAYREEVFFRHSGKPFLAYGQRTAALDDGRPLHAETGYWRGGARGRGAGGPPPPPRQEGAGRRRRPLAPGGAPPSRAGHHARMSAVPEAPATPPER